MSSNTSGAKYGHILPVKFPRDNVESTMTMMYTIFNESFTKGGNTSPASQEDFDFAKKFFNITEKLLAEGKLKTHPEKTGANGLAGALQGLKEMEDGKYSGQKLVYRVKDTPADSQTEISF